MLNFKYIEVPVDIYQYPEFDKGNLVSNSSELTLGDLHANVVKLLYALVRHGFVEISKSDYELFVKLYTKDQKLIEKSELDEFKIVVERIKCLPNAQGALLRLIGDLLADRGSNDYYTLKLLQKLCAHKIKVEILLSNHDVEFIHDYEHHLSFDMSSLVFGQSVSSENLQVLIDKDLVHLDEVLNLIETVYKPNLKALSVSQVDSGELVIYSHAPIRFKDVLNIAIKLGVYQDDTKLLHNLNELSDSNDIINLICNINDQFSKHVFNNHVSDLIEVPMSFYFEIDSEHFPFFYLIWNRSALQENRYPHKIAWVHGHDLTNFTNIAENHYNLDNYLGKGVNLNQGIYNVIFIEHI